MKKRGLLTICAVVMLAGLTWAAIAAPTAFTFSWWSVDGGGGRSEGDGLVVSGTAGQLDASSLTGEGYTLGGGFWSGGELVPPGHDVYLPLVVCSQ